MIRRPPRSTRTDTLLPYTTLFRSPHQLSCKLGVAAASAPARVLPSGHRSDRGPCGRCGACGGWPALPVVPELPCTSIRGYRENPSRSEEHTSELQSLMRISYAVFCLKKKIHNT